MRTVLALAALALAIAVPQAARAAELKIGYVNLQRAVTEVDEGKAARTPSRRSSTQKQKKLDDKQNELKRMKDDLEKQMVVMSDGRQAREGRRVRAQGQRDAAGLRPDAEGPGRTASGR